MYCNYCKRDIADDSVFCPECGARVATNSQLGGQQYSGARNNAPEQWASPPPQAAPMYAPVRNDYYSAPANKEIIGVGGVIGMFLLESIPLIGFILMLVWAFGSAPLMKKNIAKAQLLLILITSVVMIVMMALGVNFTVDLADLMSGYY